MRTKTVIDFFGSKNKACEAIGISRANFTKWGYYVPQSSAIKFGDIKEDGLKYEESIYNGDVGMTVFGESYVLAAYIGDFVGFTRAIKRGVEFYKLEEGARPQSVTDKESFKNLPLFTKPVK